MHLRCTASFFLGMLKEAETLEADRGTISTAWYSMSVGRAITCSLTSTISPAGV